MFSQFFFLIATLFLIALAPEREFVKASGENGALLIGLYVAILGAISFLRGKLKESSSLYFAQIALLFYLWLAYFYLGIQAFIPTETLCAASSLALYFYAQKLACARHRLSLVIPLAFPYLFICFLSDLSQVLSPWISLTLSVALLIGIFLYYPFFLIHFWQCTKLPPSPLKVDLENLCARMRFQLSGFYLWKPLKGSLTAAMLGVFSSCRYILLTDSLVRSLPYEAVVAVVAHEIGHSKRHHLLYYPLILSGMMVVSLLAFLLISDPPIALMIALVAMGLYFRFVFGYYSRQFEREADLFVFDADLPADDLIKALDVIGIKTGNSHILPCWHHFSLHERIEFLKKAKSDFNVVKLHRKKVKWSMVVFLVLWSLGQGVPVKKI